jgi:hypothetical protein
MKTEIIIRAAKAQDVLGSLSGPCEGWRGVARWRDGCPSPLLVSRAVGPPAASQDAAVLRWLYALADFLHCLDVCVLQARRAAAFAS